MKRRRIPSLAVSSHLVLALGFGAGRQGVAQDRGPQPVPVGLDSADRRVEFMSPRSGPPGTVVTLRTGTMPSITPLRIGIGAVRFGFEEVGQVLTNVRGEFTLTVTVPSWARRDLTHRFIVFDFYFVPIALSENFYVTGPDGTVLREGALVSTAPPCPVLEGQDGVRYALAGDLSGFQTGSQVAVEGRIVESPACRDRATLAIVRIGPAVR